MVVSKNVKLIIGIVIIIVLGIVFQLLFKYLYSVLTVAMGYYVNLSWSDPTMILIALLGWVVAILIGIIYIRRGTASKRDRYKQMTKGNY